MSPPFPYPRPRNPLAQKFSLPTSSSSPRIKDEDFLHSHCSSPPLLSLQGRGGGREDKSPPPHSAFTIRLPLSLSACPFLSLPSNLLKLRKSSQLNRRWTQSFTSTTHSCEFRTQNSSSSRGGLLSSPTHHHPPNSAHPECSRHRELPNPVSHHWETKNSFTFPRDKLQKQLAQSRARARELEQASKQARRWPLLPLLLSLSLSNKASTRSPPGAQETAGVDRGRRPRRQASNRAVTVPGFSFCFLSLAQKTLFLFFLFFPLIKESTTKHPMNTYIPGNDDFFEN